MWCAGTPNGPFDPSSGMRSLSQSEDSALEANPSSDVATNCTSNNAHPHAHDRRTQTPTCHL